MAGLGCPIIRGLRYPMGGRFPKSPREDYELPLLEIKGLTTSSFTFNHLETDSLASGLILTARLPTVP